MTRKHIHLGGNQEGKGRRERKEGKGNKYASGI
jgi:hypothetical protein